MGWKKPARILTASLLAVLLTLLSSQTRLNLLVLGVKQLAPTSLDMVQSRLLWLTFGSGSVWLQTWGLIVPIFNASFGISLWKFLPYYFFFCKHFVKKREISTNIEQDCASQDFWTNNCVSQDGNRVNVKTTLLLLVRWHKVWTVKIGWLPSIYAI